MASPPVATNASEVGFDGKAMCAFALKAPVAKRTGDTLADQNNITQRQCLIRIVDQLVKQPHRIIPMHAHLLMLESCPETFVKDDNMWTGAYKFLSQIPRAWMAQFVQSEAARLQLGILTPDLLSRIELDDADNIPSIFSFMVQLPMNLAFPKKMSDPHVAKLVFKARCLAVGNRLQWLVNKGGITADGKLDMRKGGPFLLTFNTAGACTQVAHCSGLQATPPAHMPIDRTFTLVDNILDSKAAVVLQPRHDYLFNLFPGDSPFLQTMWTPKKKCKFLDALADTHYQEVQVLDEQRQSAAIVNSEAMQPAARKRQADNAERCKRTLVAAAEKRQRKRQVALAD